MRNSLKSSIMRIAAALVLAALLFLGYKLIGERAGGGGDSLPSQSAESAAQAEESASFGNERSEDGEPVYNFRRSEYLTEHFEKHGAEFGYKTEREYLEGANSVIADKASLRKTEAEDGDYIFFQESTGGIVFVSVDGYIRTYFKPDDGIDYYNRQ
ncbi:MAG: hypothetical protein NC223_07240 [Butyrivibrio sp.]|nr:hypothetical protein [Butyrivibrio sp.]